MKKLILAVSLGVALGSFGDAVPVVSNATMTQPATSREVTIAYKLSDAPAVVTLDIQTNATDGTWASIGGENIQNVTGDVWKQVAAGEHEIKWRPDLSWPDHKIAAGGARAVVTAWSLDNPPDYMVVNIAADAAANSETYYPSVEFLPGGLLENEDYRLSKIVMRKIPAKGVEWTMGSVETETGRDGGSEATHVVTLGDNYYVGVFEVTQAQWARIQNAAMPSNFSTEREMRPVEQVSYNTIRTSSDATAAYPSAPHADSFLGLLRTKTGLLFDLPSEAQWEFACRAGHGSGSWSDGSEIASSGHDENLDLLGRNYYNGGYVQGAGEGGATSYTWPAGTVSPENGTAKAGSYAPNDWGLYDMHGNVWELCLDLYEADISELNGAVNTTASGTDRVRRGGCWNGDAGSCRAARRLSFGADGIGSDVGFRLALPAQTSGQTQQ